MSDLKRIVCLANSRKLTGRCIAGLEWSEEQVIGSWVRPVSARENQEVSEYERQYSNGNDPRVLDIINIPVIGPQPKDHQSENWLLNPDYYWEKVGEFSRSALSELVAPIAPLWIDGQSTYHGQNDKVSLESIGSVADSLRLIHVGRLDLAVFNPGEAFGTPKRRVQGQFTHGGTEYKLWVTDPQYERAYLAKPDGTYGIGECYLTISLGEPFKGAYYKLIAAIIEAD